MFGLRRQEPRSRAAGQPVGPLDRIGRRGVAEGAGRAGRPASVDRQARWPAAASLAGLSAPRLRELIAKRRPAGEVDPPGRPAGPNPFPPERRDAVAARAARLRRRSAAPAVAGTRPSMRRDPSSGPSLRRSRTHRWHRPQGLRRRRPLPREAPRRRRADPAGAGPARAYPRSQTGGAQADAVGDRHDATPGRSREEQPGVAQQGRPVAPHSAAAGHEPDRPGRRGQPAAQGARAPARRAGRRAARRAPHPAQPPRAARPRRPDRQRHAGPRPARAAARATRPSPTSWSTGPSRSTSSSAASWS